ncbi:MAG: hypothetical protein B7C24_17645 [Bacteroidetes bacterium 4572_77]|nr:MAG: hypothetical protein B7C24_17645 [Bacteroidetes bacterium 4572_77]
MKALNTSTGVCGRYKLRKFKKTKSGKPYDIVDTGWFDNLITNTGLDSMLTVDNFVYEIVVGTGNSTPLVTNTSLDNLVTSKYTSQSFSGAIEYGTDLWYVTRQKYTQFPEGDAAGNLQEVGVQTATGDLVSRALIVDDLGNPTTLTVLSNEFLTVEYEFRQYPVMSDITGTIVFTGSKAGSYDYTMRLSRVHLNDGTQRPNKTENTSYSYGYSDISTLDDIYGYPTSGRIATNNYSINNETYVPGSFYSDATIFFNTTIGNAPPGGINTLRFKIGNFWWQVEFDPVIPKRDTDELTLTVRTALSRKSL